jgi:shikimate kinase
MRIYIIGITGSGKSTIGKELAKKINYDFIDLDKFIESNEKLSIQEIFKLYTEAFFRLLEKKYLEKTFEMQNVVVSTGGGTPCFYNGIEKMNSNGITIWLNTPLSVIAQRLYENPNLSQRPLIKENTLEGIKTFLEIKLKERKKFYSKASITLNSPDVDTLLKELKKIDGLIN